VPTPAETAAGTAQAQSSPELERALEDLQRAREDAEEASTAARAATLALEEYEQKQKMRFARKGVFLEASVFWAPNLFDTRLDVKNSKGLAGGLGYRFNSRFEVEARWEGFQKFELSGLNMGGDFEGWSATANGRFFLLTGVFQPYLGIGLGAIHGKVRLWRTDEQRFIEFTETAALFRTSGGFDFYISPNIALTADASVNLPGGALTGLDYATVGGGLKLRF
jgi:opacity protein-like surface antigen